AWLASRSSGDTRRSGLPAVVSEGLVGLRHAVDVVLALVGVALLLRGVEQLVGQALRHRLLAAGAGELDQPAHGKGASPAGGNLDRYLIGGAADAAGADLEHRGQGLDSGLPLLDGVLAAALTENGQGVVDDLL